MKNLIWLHEDCLRDNHPAFELASENKDVIFVWDKQYFKDQDYSFKRLVFIYETLCELSVEIIEGNQFEIILEYFKHNQLNNLYIPYSPNPKIIEISKKLSKIISVFVIHDRNFAEIDPSKSPPNLKRFFNYWKKVEKSLLNT